MKHFIIIVVICLTSCKAQKETQLVSQQKKDEMILIAQDAYSGIDKYETMVVRDAKSLNKFYARINKTRKPGLPVPFADFSKEMILILCLGEQKGEKMPILSMAKESENEVLIAIEIANTTKIDVDKNQHISYPFYIYRTPLTSKIVNFQKIGQ